MDPDNQPPRASDLESRVMTSPMLKAMSHPLRRRIVSVLGAQDYARATDLARQLGVAANTLSFHLRSLADAGFVEEAPEHARDRRDRVWRGVNQSYKVGSPEEPIGPDDEAPLAAYLHQMTMDQQEMVAKVLAWAPNYATGREADAKGELSIGTLRLTQDEATAVFAEVCAVLDRARSLHHEPSPSDEADGVRAWDYTFMAAREDL
ncbi:ArsR/SmtB family transcription factor [Arthrobacter sp.]|uniref:ArsR/SmtB family transcription factor n=1 Tax=Arthrobacter sp. TaxID=1667 RepID=UPI003A920484